MATPMFEPSDMWKQTHVDRPGLSRAEVYDASSLTKLVFPSNPRFNNYRPPSLIDRHAERRILHPRERSPERPSARNHYSPPHFPGGDRYRPYGAGYTHREPFQVARADCYRPKYDNDRGTTRVRERDSPVERKGRVSNSTPLHARSPLDSRRPPSRERSSSRSISPWLRACSPAISSRRSVSNRETAKSSDTPPSANVKVETCRLQDAAETALKVPVSRPLSRSSIASSRPSDKSDYVPGLEPSGFISSEFTPASADPPTVSSVVERPVEDVEQEPLLPQRSSPQIHGQDIPSLTSNHQSPHSENRDEGMKYTITPRTQSPESMIQSVSSEAPHEPEPPASDFSLGFTVQQDEKQANVLSSALSSVPPLQTGTEIDSAMEIDTDATANDLPTTPAEPSPQQNVVDTPPTWQDATHHTQNNEAIDFTLDDIPPMSSAKSLKDALRVVVMTRLLCDRQTREERVDPILMANLSLSAHHASEYASPVRALSQEEIELNRAKEMDSILAVRPSLAARFAERQATLEAKTQRLREEYLTLHERWLAHCARLDSAPKVGITEEATPNTGRTTRRSAATLGDAVRSDLEMEQIIASLGNDELTDPNHLAVRNVAVIPDMISVVHGRVDYLFDDTNNLVHDPGTFYGPETGIHDWTEEEKLIFQDKFATYPKQFGVIADFLPNKCAAQCVDYYYLHKKSLIDFRQVVSQLAPNKRRRGSRRDKQKGNGLLADIRQHDDEVHRDSASNGPMTRRKRILQPIMTDGRRPGSSRRSTVQMEASPLSTPTPEPETRQRRRRTNPPARSSVVAGQDEGNEDGTVSAKFHPPSRYFAHALFLGRTQNHPGQQREDESLASQSPLRTLL